MPDISKICEDKNGPKQSFAHHLSFIHGDAWSMENRPHEVNDCVHVIYIHMQDDYPTSRSKQIQERQFEFSFWGEFRLPKTPCLGEEISLEFVQQNVRYNRGVVTRVQHEIRPEVQRIIIYVHP
ncbi:hypothetical protein DQQ10_26270 [Pseudochryseolinea flava]|uniref:Uncharacterized protein n=1 Tax=Pseudochryseolinea flava TaxID=2059302 RepID=A0A364XUL4_9BACT|nr:hypothetical protein DQQ10_26270 [Pseudochryseolinea flava]